MRQSRFITDIKKKKLKKKTQGHSANWCIKTRVLCSCSGRTQKQALWGKKKEDPVLQKWISELGWLDYLWFVMSLLLSQYMTLAMWLSLQLSSSHKPDAFKCNSHIFRYVLFTCSQKQTKTSRSVLFVSLGFLCQHRRMNKGNGERIVTLSIVSQL